MVFVATHTIFQFINELVAGHKEISLLEFAHQLHEQFYQHIDISFMKEFFEISKQDNEGKFVIEHQMLIKYGITTNPRSNDIKDRLTGLGLQEWKEGMNISNANYLLRNVPQQGPSGVKHKKVYMLTPEAFFTALMRAQHRKNQTTDPTIYAMYFQFLQKVAKNYADYQTIMKEVENKILEANNKSLTSDNRTLTDKVDELLEDNASLKTDVKSLLKDNTELKNTASRLVDDNVELKNTANQLLTYSQSANVMLVDMKANIDELAGIARMVLPMWVGSSVAKTMMTEYKERYNTDMSAVQHMKNAFVCGFYNKNKLKVYFCCTNFIEMGPRISKLFKDRNKNGVMYMLQPKAINLASCDIGIELATIRGAEFKNISFKLNGKTKSFDITVAPNVSIDTAYQAVVSQLIDSRLQLHQKRQDEMIANQNLMMNTAVMTHIASTDKMFFDKTRPWCQMYIDGYTTTILDNHNVFIEYGYRKLDMSTYKRPSFNNKWMRDNQYALMNIKQLVDEDKGVSVFDDMVKNGVITEEDRPILTALANSMTK